MPAAGTNKWEEALGIDANSIAAEKLAEEVAAAEEEKVNANEYNDTVHANKEEIVQAAQNDLNFLAALVLPTVFKYFYPPVLLAVWNLLVEKVVLIRDFSQLALGVPRGMGKTTLIKLFIVYCILFTTKKFILICSRTGPLAENVLADIIDMLNEPNVKAVFGDWKMDLEKDTQNLKKFTFRGRTIILAAIGSEGSVRGLNIKHERPDVMVFEDIQDAAGADSKVQSDALERWMVGTAMKAKSPHGCLFVFIGNMFPTPYSILRKLKTNPRWIKFICGAILADGTSLWEELQPIQQLLAELDNDISMGKEDIFAAEVLNDENAKIHTRMDLAKVNLWPFNSELDYPQGRFIVIDPSGAKRGSDLVTITQFDVYDGKAAVMHIDEGSYSPGDTIKHALLLALKTKTALIGVESTAYQHSLLYWFDFICKQLGITGLEFVELQTGGFSKHVRITNGIKMLSSGDIYVHPMVRGKIISQVVSWNPLKRDNVDGILDTVGYAPTMLEMYGHLMTIDAEIFDQDLSQTNVNAQNCSFTEVTSF